MTTRWLARLGAVALILLMQGPAMLMQEIAWLGMLPSYTMERGWMRGVVETFDGEHPCEICCQAEKLRHGDAESPQPMENRRERRLSQQLAWETMVPVAFLWVRDPIGRELEWPGWIACCAPAGRGREAPLTPPPRRG